MNIHFKNLLLAACLLLLSAPFSRALDDTEIWTAFNLTEYKEGPFETRSHAELRFPGLEYLSYYRLSQKFYYKSDFGVTFGAHPTLEESRKNSGADWSRTVRLDLEANFGFEVGDFSVKTRNRYEVRRKEGKGSEAFDRFRQYTTVTTPAKWLPGMTSVGFGNEVFVEFDDTRVTINRFYPLLANFKYKGGKYSPYVMYQVKRSGNTNNWSENWVLGLNSSFSF